MARSGRKRKIGIRRQPNGQPHRSEEEAIRAMKEVVILARMRHYGVSKANAGTELAGYAIGRMALAGEFGSDWEPAITAVSEYVSATADYMRVKWPMQPMPKAMDYMAGRGTSLAPEPSLRSIERVEKRYEEMQAKLRQADGIDRMRFHDAAYHDELHNEAGRAAVKRCVAVLITSGVQRNVGRLSKTA